MPIVNQWGQTQTKCSSDTSDNEEDDDDDRDDESVNPRRNGSSQGTQGGAEENLPITSLYFTKQSRSFSVEGCVAKTNWHMTPCSLLFVC